jgi:hypothetical protein
MVTHTYNPLDTEEEELKASLSHILSESLAQKKKKKKKKKKKILAEYDIVHSVSNSR